VVDLQVLYALFMINAAAGPPPTRTDKTVDTLHGVKVADPYRWLENAEASEVKQWTAAQNAHMRKVLDGVPDRAALERRLWTLHEIGTLGTPVERGSGKTLRLFSTRRDGKQNQPVLYVREGLRGKDRVLLDVNQEAADGTLSLDSWDPSEDGTWVVYGTSKDGSEESVLRIRNTATGVDRSDALPRARAASIAWLPDASGFYYTRYPAPGSVPPDQEKYHRAVYFHALGADPARDARVFPAQDDRTRDMTDWPTVGLSPNGRWLVITVSQGWAKTEIFVVDRSRTDACAPTPVVVGKSAIYQSVEVLDDTLYVLTNDGAPRYKLLAIDPGSSGESNWKTIIAEGPDTLESVGVAGSHLVATFLHDAASGVRLFSRKGVLEREVHLPGLGSAAAFSSRASHPTVYFRYGSFLTPGTIYELDGDTGKSKLWAQLKTPIDERNFEVHQVHYPSKDGTSIPMFLVHKKGLVRDGKNPALLYGYGGFNIALTPGFAAAVIPFIEQGGLYAVANLRGGGEFGEDWHRAGMLKNKQNVFNDFAAAAEFLIGQNYTRPERLAISGRSNGGLLTGATVTQRPELFRAVIVGVPLLDMVRYHKFRIARLWIPEYGDPDKADEFAWLYAYSPYHRVKPATHYPAVLVFTAESDTRVDAMHARKMTARLQAATTSGHPVLLRLEQQAGHGAGKPLGKQIAQYTDELAFLFRELQLSAHPNAKP